MNQAIINSLIALSGLGGLSAVVLYLVAQKFKVFEDPRIDQVADLMPGANCGGCGFAGCRNFAEAIVKSEEMGSLFCPVGGNATMKSAAEVLGRVAAEKEPLVAVVRCNGSYDKRPRSSEYDGAPSCAIAHSLYAGEGACPYGCLGCGDCVTVCQFDAIHMSEATGLPVVTDSKCTSCGACVKACPRGIIEMRKKNKADRKIFVSCINKEKGPIAKKNCEVACIGCNKCVKVCPHDAIVVNSFLAYIDPFKCKLCRKCVTECPTSAILEINFPPRKLKEESVEVSITA